MSLELKSIRKYIELGEYLLDAKEHMDADDFTAMLRGQSRDGEALPQERRLPFDESKASRLMAIARNPVLIKHVESLPDTWTTVAKLARLDHATLEKAFEEGAITPEITGKDVANIAGRQPTSRGAAHLAATAYRCRRRGPARRLTKRRL